jgi:hypothetical protein
MRRIGLVVGVVAVVTSAGVVLLLGRDALGRAMGWPDTSTVLVLSLCWAAVVTGAVGGRLLSTSANGPTNRARRSVATATAVAMSGLLILAAVRWLVAAYWVGWAEQNEPCRVASGECQSTYLMYELFLIPVLLAIPGSTAAAGSWFGHGWSRHRSRVPDVR